MDEVDPGITMPAVDITRESGLTTGVRPILARVIHFGPDDCHRLMVLRSAGYAVENCDSLRQLGMSLSGGASAEAVLMSDGEGVSALEALKVARTHSALPLVLFRSANHRYEELGFDLVVHSLTPPEVWLNDVETLIERTRAVPRS
jgi:hypothetical protein